MRLVIGLLLAALAGAQTFSSSNGWSFADTLHGATNIVVADIVNGSAVDDGAMVSVKATLRVVRVLQGELAPGDEVAVSWQYRPAPFQSPAETAKVPRERGLWFLRGREPLRATTMTPELGGIYLPAGGAPRYYAPDAPIERKIACELAALIDPAGSGLRLQTVVFALEQLDRTATSDLYREFSGRPEPLLQAIGIQGRLNGGDASALLDLESKLPALTDLPPYLRPFTAMGVDLRAFLPAAHALGRLALAETALPGIEGAAPMQLAYTRSLEVLPYLAAMLESPNPGVRDATLMAYCSLLEPLPQWKPEMRQYCPDHSPLNDPALGAKDAAYWKRWWESNRAELAKTVALPDVSIPARYRAQAPPAPVEVPPEYRFQAMLNITGNGPDPLASQLTESDREIWGEVAADVRAKLEAVRKKADEMMNAARLAGSRPEESRMRELDRENRAALRAGLDALHARLSPAGRKSMEEFMGRIGVGVMTSPRPKPR